MKKRTNGYFTWQGTHASAVVPFPEYDKKQSPQSPETSLLRRRHRLIACKRYIYECVCCGVVICGRRNWEEAKLGKHGDQLLEGLFDCIYEIRAALAFSCRMTDSADRVQTTSRLAQWRIHSLASFAYRKSDPFQIGLWNWHLSVEKNRSFIIKLYPEISKLTRENPPTASFVIRLVSMAGDRKCLVHPEVTDKLLKCNDDFVWAIELPLAGKFIIDVEFLDLKASSLNGMELSSIWGERAMSNDPALVLLGRMLSEGIHTDIVINASDGSISAHRAVLASRSPVFRGMFSHNLMEKEMSAINIPDMSIEACGAFLSYIYGSLRSEEFLTHRLLLLRAADKYDLSDLKQACHESLMEDIDTRNVLERLQYASLYQLPKLKGSCIKYLVKFGKIFDIRDEFNSFLECADRELVAEVFNEVLGTWKGF